MAPDGARAEAAIRAAFSDQAGWCRKLGSPLTGLVCELLGQRLDRTTELGRAVLGWTGDPGALHDSVPLRVAGGLNALVRRGRLPRLAGCYPPHRLPDAEPFWDEINAAVADAGGELVGWLASAPQTNEVARSGVLMAGLATISARTGLPLSLFELGASAGLNLLLDRYDIGLGQRRYGQAGSRLRLRPDWEGADPPAARIRVVARRGVDLNPVDTGSPAGRERLLAYTWPDQAERVARLEAALAIASDDPPVVDRGEAADWIDARLRQRSDGGTARVVMHSIAFQYFSATTQDWIATRLAEAGQGADMATPLAWLRFEMDEEVGRPSLRLTLWPDGQETRLAIADPHVGHVIWLA